MLVNISYFDSSVLSKAEIERQAKHMFGEHAKTSVMPESDDPLDVLYFAVQQIITSDQLSLLYDSDAYNKDIKELRLKTLMKLEEVLDQVIIDNESRVS